MMRKLASRLIFKVKPSEGDKVEQNLRCRAPKKPGRTREADGAKKSFYDARRNRQYKEALQHGLEFLDKKGGHRPGFSFGLAVIAELINDNHIFRSAMVRAFADAEQAEADDKYLRKHWNRLSNFWLKCFDPQAAIRVAMRANSLGADGASTEIRKIEAMWDQDSSFYNDVVSAGAALRRFSEGGEYGANENAGGFVYLPSSMFSAKTPDFRPHQRLVASMIVRSMRELGRSYVPLPRLAHHGTPVLPRASQYVAYHTIDKGQDGLHWKELDQRNLFRFDRHGYAGWSKLASTDLKDLSLGQIDPIKARRFVDHYRSTVSSTNASKYSQPDLRVGEDLPSRYVFVALQMLDDTVQLLGRMSCLEMLEDVAAACRAKQIPVVVKRHPLCESDDVQKFLEVGSFQGDFIISRASIHRLLRDAVAICTVNSGVGAEALAYRKPVYLFGKADYQHVCFQISEPGEFASKFELGKMAVSEDDLDRYVYFYRNYGVVNSDSDDAFDKVKCTVREFVLDRPQPSGCP